MDPVSPWLGWLIVGAFYGVPTMHVLISPRSGAWRPPTQSRCPFGPRVGWLIIVLMLGPIGWGLYLLRRPRATA